MEENRRALIVVDVQNDFCEGGALAVTGGSEIAGLITQYLGNSLGIYHLVVATRDNHINPSGHFDPDPDFLSTWPVHCLKGSLGAEFHPALDTSLIDHTVFKGDFQAAYSGFEGKTAQGETLLELLERLEIEVLDICGIATDYCVLQTALDALDRGYPTTVFIDLIAGVTEQGALEALEELQSRGANLTYALREQC